MCNVNVRRIISAYQLSRIIGEQERDTSDWNIAFSVKQEDMGHISNNLLLEKTFDNLQLN